MLKKSETMESCNELNPLDFCTILTVKVYQCKICLESITNFTSFQEHLNLFHPRPTLDADLLNQADSQVHQDSDSHYEDISDNSNFDETNCNNSIFVEDSRNSNNFDNDSCDNNFDADSRKSSNFEDDSSNCNNSEDDSNDSDEESSDSINFEDDSSNSNNSDEESTGSDDYDGEEIDVGLSEFEPNAPTTWPFLATGVKQDCSYDEFCEDKLCSEPDLSCLIGDASLWRPRLPETEIAENVDQEARRRYFPELESTQHVTVLVAPEARTSRSSSSRSSDLDALNVQDDSAEPKAKRLRVDQPVYFSKLTMSLHQKSFAGFPHNFQLEAPAATKSEPDQGSALINYSYKIPIPESFAELQVLAPSEGFGTFNGNISSNYATYDGCGGAFFCLYCSSMFGTDLSLKIHIAEKHRDIRPYCCYVCPESFYTRYHSKLHKKRDHPCLTPRLEY